MEQIEILCGFNGTLAFMSAICSTLARFVLPRDEMLGFHLCLVCVTFDFAGKHLIY